MATVLLAWELGGGFGHLDRLLPIARGLAKLGHQPIIAGRDIVLSRAIMRGDEFPLLQAPIWHRRQQEGQPPFVATGFTDILAQYGFGSADGLFSIVQAWQALVDLVRPAVIVADFAPALCTAAYGHLPVVQIGNGFTMPPVHHSIFPRLSAETASSIPDARVHEVVREVQRRRGRPQPETLTAIFRTAARFVLIWPELDPYHTERDEPLVGPLEHPAPASPAPNNPTTFAYLSATYAGVGEILQRLAQAGLLAGAYVRGLSPHVASQLRVSGVKLHAEPPVLETALAKSAVILHHGGINTGMEALALGRPQMLLPQHLEQKLTGHALEKLGVGKMLSGRIMIDQIVQRVRELGSESCLGRAEAIAKSLWQRKTGNPLDSVIAACDSLCRSNV